MIAASDVGPLASTITRSSAVSFRTLPSRVWRCSPAGEVRGLELAKEPQPTSRGFLHVGFDAEETLHALEWTYGARRETQKFNLQRFDDPQQPPTVVFASNGADDHFLDFHLGSMLVTGDGSAGFHIQEFETMVRHGLPIITIILNNQAWGMSWHGQMQLFGENFISSDCAS